MTSIKMLRVLSGNGFGFDTDGTSMDIKLSLFLKCQMNLLLPLAHREVNIYLQNTYNACSDLFTNKLLISGKVILLTLNILKGPNLMVILIMLMRSLPFFFFFF